VARNDTIVNAPIEAVWRLLAEPESYAAWVVGANAVHEHDPTWPQPGATFVHEQGPGGPLSITDTTTVLECRQPEYLLLEIRVRPLLVGKVELILRDLGGTTSVLMHEWMERGLVGRLHNPLFDRLIKARNVEALRRLRHLAERDAGREAPAAA